MQRILLADDEHDLIWAIQHSLSNDGYQVVTACDGMDALMAAGRHQPDLVILDVSMPRLDGWQVCQSLRRDEALAGVPILFLTGSDTVDDRIRGLEEGADDYLVKPFDLRELKARVRALLRRRAPAAPPAPPASPGLLMAGDLQLNMQTCEAALGGRSAQLTPAEFELLHFLISHPNQVFASQQLLRDVWGYAPASADQGLVRWHMMNLRSKIEPNPARPIYLRTVPRHGYMLCVQSQIRAA
jgi:DNA-binding response OmpR family regulator